MAKIRSKDTKPELLLRRELWRIGYRYRVNVNSYPGRPDILFKTKKLVVFVDGEFWHGYEWEKKKAKLKSNRDYWIPKIEKNIVRDSANNEYYAYNNFKVIRFWQREIMSDLSNCVKTIINHLGPARKSVSKRDTLNG